tara:strand:+ start:2146 stop:5334 length:3189 start_codon:yes stop_codon:yes gene_type:complete
MIILKNQIKEIKSKFQAIVLPGTLESGKIGRDTLFNIKLFATIEKSNILFEKAKKIEIFFQTTNINDRVENSGFTNKFNNLYAYQTSDYKKYFNSQSGLPESYKNDIRSNLIVDYYNRSNLSELKNSSFNALFSTTVDFDKDKFTSENANQYEITLTQADSKTIFEKNFDFNNNIETNEFFDKVRIAILDDKNNILDVTNFFGIDLSSNNINENIKLVSFAEFYGDIIDTFVDNFSLEFSSTTFGGMGSFTILPRFKLFGDEKIYLRDGLIEAKIIYTSNNISTEIIAEKRFLEDVVESEFIVDSSSLKEGNIGNINDLIKDVIKDFLCGVENFKIDVEINFKNVYSVRGTERTNSIRNFTKSTNFNRQNIFIENLLEYCDIKEITNQIITEILNNVVIDAISTETLGTKVGIDFDLSLGCEETYDNRVLDNIVIEEIEIDIGRSQGILDFYYSQPNFDLSNKVNYRNKSIRFFNNNSKIWSIVYIGSIFRNNFEFKFTIKHTDRGSSKTISKNVQNFESVNKISTFIENTQNLTNKIFNENMFCGDINFNLFLNESSGNIFNYETFILKNSNLFQNVALGYGYDSENNIRDFLSSSILKIKIQKKINGDNLSNYETFCNFEDFFKNSETNENSYNVKSSFLEILYNTELNTKKALSELGFRHKSNDILRFLNSDSSDIYEKLIILNNLEEFNITCSIQIQILPFPSIIRENLGVGFINDRSSGSRRFRNIDINIPDSLSDDDAEKIAKEFEIMYADFVQFNNNDMLDPNFTNQVDQILFKEISDRKPNTYSHLFELFKEFSISNNNIYEKKENINKLKISKAISNLDDDIIEDLINSSNISLSGDFYDLSKSLNFINYRQIPFSIFYDQSQYDSINKCFKPKGIQFYNNSNESFVLDLSYLRNVERYSNLVRSDEVIFNINELSDKFENSVINEDIIFVLKEYDISNEYNSILNSNYQSSFYKGDFCLLSNNFLNQNYNSGQGIQQQDIGERNDLNDFFDFAITNGFNVIKDIIIRTYLSFSLDNDEIKVVFSTSIPNVNLSNQTIKIENIASITSELVSI